MNKDPWLSAKNLKLVHLLLTSHQHAFGRPLIQSLEVDFSLKSKGQELFFLDMPVIAHDNNIDPCLNYANAAALQLWCRHWNEMIGMPSRMTAPLDAQHERDIALAKAMTQDIVEGYQGIRIDSKGHKFQISNARIWTLWDTKGFAIGQAATFNQWCYLSDKNKPL